MEIKEFRALTPEELDEKIYEFKSELFELRRKKATGTLEKPEQMHAVRKDLAKAQTVKRERELGINQ